MEISSNFVPFCHFSQNVICQPNVLFPYFEVYKSEKQMKLFFSFFSTLTLIFQTSPFTLCGKSFKLERKYIVLRLLYLKNEIHHAICFILESLPAQINVINANFF